MPTSRLLAANPKRFGASLLRRSASRPDGFCNAWSGTDSVVAGEYVRLNMPGAVPMRFLYREGSRVALECPNGQVLSWPTLLSTGDLRSVR